MITNKYGFRIRTRQGLLIERLSIHGRDAADAERKLRQMYQHCEILQQNTLAPPILRIARTVR
ncbi:MAG: hypothetical protein A3I01_16160 [Betaproteobacteria bacterium RIFCSPLOWO2_02_FULL_65_24]|nr:MAG: hypothetical protein A3I01_16160 [Betaproteobacteria bacterium RIFCSPLOWO2_02_FULL_65_24]OGA82914.1 MAG: hypothetical protein A3G27_08760 [Betaproteobacteria bacterium RIFCSPLOWO2_12_FULL_66_14]